MAQEKLYLTWHTYTDHLKGMLHDMMSSNELTDVTLVSEDKKRFKAHKVILSASSSVFKSIISDNIVSSPIIYLKGIQAHEIESILQFIYLGEAKFYQERMNEFFNVAKSLEIKEISKNIEIAEKEQNENYEEQENNIDIPEFEPKESYGKQEKKLLERKPMSTKIREVISNLPRQFEKNNDSKYFCYQCNFKALSKSSSHLQTHIRSVHEGVKYPCDQCNHKASTSTNLHRHMKSVHDGVKYPCDQCNYKAARIDYLQKHKKSIHGKDE